MFFSHEINDFELRKHIKNEWGSLFAFCEEMNDIHPEVRFLGNGFLQKKQVDQFYDFLSGYILELNNSFYIILGEDNTPSSENSWFKFKSIVEVDKLFINTEVLTLANNSYSKFESELIVELKHYQYQEEERLMISKKGIGNIDLYASYSIKNKEKLLNGKVYPAAAVAAKNQLMTNLLNERFSSVKKGSEEEISDLKSVLK